MKRRTTIKLLGGVLGGAVIGSFAWSEGVQAAGANNRDRAVASYNAMQKYFYKQDGSHLYLEQYPAQSGDNTYSYEWPFSQAHIATIDLSTVPGLGLALLVAPGARRKRYDDGQDFTRISHK